MIAAAALCAAIGAAAPIAPSAAPPATAVTAPAVPPPAQVTLAEVFRLLREASPRTAAERGALGIAAAEGVAARVLPNPVLDYDGTFLHHGANTGSADSSDLAIEQPLLLFGQRGARTRSADLALQAATSGVAAAHAERARRARAAFVTLLARQERVGLLDAARLELERVAHVVTARAEAGEKSRYDALRITLELRTREADLAAARAETEASAGELAAAIGLPAWRPEAAGTLEPLGLAGSDEAALWADASAALPDLVAARRDEAAARGDVERERRERLPVPVLTAGGQFTHDEESTSYIAGLAIPLPVFDRGQGELARAGARADAAALEVAARSAEARADLHSALGILRTRRDALDALDRDVIGRLPEVARMSEDAYHEGQADILDLLDAQRARTGALLTRLDALEAVAQAEGDVLALTGRIEEAPGDSGTLLPHGP
ncbi:MAG TPA: TolC family protein [Dongiaceae bacterium]|nr:TolC family protein [Dongiaceae bacterium]